MPGPFDELRVLELGDHARQTGKLLGDLGADVVRVERGEKTPASTGTRPSYYDLVAWSFNTSKRSITLDLQSEPGRDRLIALSRGADIVLDGLGPGSLEALGLGPATLRAGNPRLIVMRESRFGQDGPWKDYQAGDLVSMALGGVMMSCGYDEEGSPPICPDELHSEMVTGIWGLIGVSAALVEREQSGEGQVLDLATHDALAITTEQAVMFVTAMEADVHRQAARHAAPEPTPPWLVACADRYLSAGLFSMAPSAWTALVQWMDQRGMAADLAGSAYADPAVLRDRAAHVSEVLAAFFTTVPAEEVFRRTQEMGLAWGPVNTPDDLLLDPHLAAIGYFQPVTPPGMDAPLLFPGAPYRFEKTPWAIHRRPPLPGEHTGELKPGAADAPGFWLASSKG